MNSFLHRITPHVEQIVIPLVALAFVGFMGFARGDLDAAYEAKNNAMPVFVQMADISQHGFKGTFPP